MFRRRFQQTTTLKQRLIDEARELREEARLLPVGPVRDAALTRARQLDAAADMDDWLTSPSLQSSKKHDVPGP